MDRVVGDGRVARRQRRRLPDLDRARRVRVGGEVVAQAHAREVDEILRLAREVQRVADRDEVGRVGAVRGEPHGQAAAVADPVGGVGVAAAVGQPRGDRHRVALQVGRPADRGGVGMAGERARADGPLRVHRTAAGVLAERAPQRCDELGRVRRRHGRTIAAPDPRLARTPMPDIAASSADARRGPPSDDGALLAACRGGDSRAFVELVRRHHPALRALAGCWPGAAHEAERDVAQAWLAALGRDGSPRPVRPRAAWPREIQEAPAGRTHAPLEPAPAAALDASRFFVADHELWPGEWADPPRPWGPPPIAASVSPTSRARSRASCASSGSRRAPSSRSATCTAGRRASALRARAPRSPGASVPAGGSRGCARRARAGGRQRVSQLRAPR